MLDWLLDMMLDWLLDILGGVFAFGLDFAELKGMPKWCWIFCKAVVWLFAILCAALLALCLGAGSWCIRQGETGRGIGLLVLAALMAWALWTAVQKIRRKRSRK